MSLLHSVRTRVISLAAAGVVVFFLIGGITTYYFVNVDIYEGRTNEAVEQNVTPAIETRVDLETRRG